MLQFATWIGLFHYISQAALVAGVCVGIGFTWARFIGWGNEYLQALFTNHGLWVTSGAVGIALVSRCLCHMIVKIVAKRLTS